MIARPAKRRQRTTEAGEGLIGSAEERQDRALLCLSARALDAGEVLHRGVDLTERLP
jgi:hypothetical protein